MIRIFHKINFTVKALVFRDRFLLSARKWFKDKGDETLRLDYDLNQDSVVFDIGGYEGAFSEKIFNKYQSNIYIFEPVKSFYKTIYNKFKDIEKIRLYHFGLSDITKELEISLSDDASSIHINTDRKEKIKLYSIVEFIEQNNIVKIDLMKINIEGGEFDLLPALLDHNIITNIDNLQIQFHKFIENAEIKRENIRNQLSKTHELTYDYYFIWENWRLKK